MRKKTLVAAAVALIAAGAIVGVQRIRQAAAPHVWTPVHRFVRKGAAAPVRHGAPRVIAEFDFTRRGASTQGWHAQGDAQDLRVQGGALRLRVGAGEAWLVRAVNVEAAQADAVEVELEVNARAQIGQLLKAQVRWASDGAPTRPRPRAGLARLSTGAGRLVGFPRFGRLQRVRREALLVASPRWRGRISRLELSPCGERGEVAIYRIALLQTGATLADVLRVRGETMDRLSIGGEFEDTFVCRTREPVEFPAAAPAPALLEYHYGVIETAWSARARRVNFSVRVLDRGGRAVASREHEVDPRREDQRGWHAASLRLPAARGRFARFQFSTTPPMAGAWGGVTLCQWRPQPGPRNIVVVLFDALRASEVGCYGGPSTGSGPPLPGQGGPSRAESRGGRGGLTPTMDKLSRSGLWFANARATSSWTAPSVASIFTSLLPSEVATSDRPISRFALGATTVTELLRKQGYATAGIVASQLIKHGGGFDQGFDTYDEQPVARFDRPECSADMTAKGIRWLRRHRDRRFFLYLHYMDPHEPYDPPPQYARKAIPPATGAPAATPPPRRDIIREGMMVKTRLALMNEPGFHLSKEDVAWLHDLYRAETAYVDHELSVLISGLRKLGLAKNTIVVVLSDHGEEFMEHGWLDHGWSLYEEVLRVPLIIWGPRIPARKVEAPVSLLDIAPTILDAAGIRRPRDMRGRSLLARGRRDDAVIFSDLVGWRDPWPGPHGIPRQAIVSGDIKLIHNLGATAPEFELYDLRRDPGERNNLVATAAQAAPGAPFERLRAQLAAVNESLREPPLEAEPSGPPMDDESRERLKSLGYIQ